MSDASQNRFIILCALPIGFVCGSLVFAYLALVGGNDSWRAYLTAPEALRLGTGNGFAGIVVAATALIGGTVAVALKDQRLRRPRSARIWWAAIGAAAAVVALGIAVEIAVVIMEPTAWLGLFVLGGMWLTVPAGAIAAGLVALTERNAKAPPTAEVSVDG
ncbi:hypothetical protein [Diaminobutyricimonas sp. TR449]|uniref:hypothetical protein n=1 Tax=Diaminobutyricimonas sp. TR449 TaxID=2708076 RepID=UPI001423C85C|nr:hypothetical protein [Diaminobutyricimonas sp. TR449]